MHGLKNHLDCLLEFKIAIYVSHEFLLKQVDW